MTPVKTVRKQFHVTGMSCAACTVSVESTLGYQPGVVAAAVNFATQTVLVEFEPERIAPQAMKEAVQSIGYDLVVEETEEAREEVEHIHRHHYDDLRRRTIWALVLAGLTGILGMFFMDLPFLSYLLWALSTPVVFWLGRSFFINAWKRARHRSANMDTLVALSTGIAYIFIVCNTIFPDFWHPVLMIY